uniref:Cytochrome b n=1 Tax=Philometroides sanguineus TaxID=378106 RepID=A0A0U1XA72_9BILA|nr:cytochrome b [Philometroides sanguineus]AIN37107.1 cytochrome b [Philometroides sanguineus]
MNVMMKSFNNMVVVLPTSKSLDLNWNYGSMLGMILAFQILTGLLLTFFYSNDSQISFDSVQYIMSEVNGGWLYRIFHFNGASLFFIFIYMHFLKGLFNFSYRLGWVWLSGLVILFLLIMEAFMGYVLVWAQMSFWACVVITSLLSVVPYFGPKLVLWVWGGFTVSGATLKLFFAIHFLLPWGLMVLAGLHMVLLHSSGSTSVVGNHGDYDKISFFPYYWVKDSYNLVVWMIFFFFVFSAPFILGDPEMFLEANALMSPVHIVPEWYFLFVYAILRAVPDKVLGVILLLMSILIFSLFSMVSNYYGVMDVSNDYLVYLFIFCVVILSWLGQSLVEFPFSVLSGVFSMLYFVLVLMLFVNYFFTKFLFE